jgi:dTDP-4-amino-4,6-dideoxy-D-galactose acyltransferase
MSTPSYRLLSWDSDFLGFAVARIAPEIDDDKSITLALCELKKAGVRLAYWPPRHSARVRNFARAAGATFVGTQLRFERATVLGDAGGGRGDLAIERCLATSGELEDLAVVAGTLSRFALDPAMPPGTAARLYTLWMRESFGGAMGDAVLAARDASGIAGMVTLKYQAASGVIGLVAVAERSRGAGVGRFLVEAATARFAALGMQRASVVTQGENAAACGLYQRCGYALAESSLIAHFWL